MIKASPSDNNQAQPNQRRAQLFVSDQLSFFEIKENDFQSSNLLDNCTNLKIDDNLKEPNTKISENKHAKFNLFSFEQLDKINIPPNRQEAKLFVNKIQSSVESIDILPNPRTNFQNEKSDNFEYSLSNLHILFSKDDYHPIPFHVSPSTSISSPFNNNILFDQEAKETNDELKFQISSDSVAYRQCIDIELNNNFEFSEISTFSADLIQNSIEETQNVEIYDTNNINKSDQISIDSSYEMFEQIEKSRSQNKNLNLSQLSSFENEKLDSLQNEKKKSIEITEEENNLNNSIKLPNSIQLEKSTKSIQTQNFEESNSFNFVKLKSIDVINDEKIDSNINNNENKKFVALISDPVHYSIKRNDSKSSLQIETHQNFSSMELSKPAEVASKNLINSFKLSPIESIASSTFDNQSDENNLFDTTSNKSNELQICSVSHIDFNKNDKDDEIIFPKFEESDFETIISLNKKKKMELNTMSSPIKIKFTNLNESQKHENNDSSNEESTSVTSSDSNIFQNVTPKKRKIPRFTTSELSTMANIRYSPQIENLKNSSSVFAESENALNLSFQESDISTMTSINYIPDKAQILESSPFSIEKIDQKENDFNETSNSIDLERKTKKQIPQFTTSELSTMANVRHSPQKDINNTVHISSSLIPSYLENNDQNISFNDNDDNEIIISNRTIESEEEEEYNINIVESEITTIISIDYDPTISQEDEDQQINDNQEKKVKLNKKEIKININNPHFTTSDLSIMANIRYSPKSTYSNFSSNLNNQSNISENELIKESEVEQISSRKFIPFEEQIDEHTNKPKEDKIKTPQTKLEKQIPLFTTSEPSTMMNDNKTNQDIKLEESQVSAIEINDENTNNSIEKEIENNDEKGEFNSEININESELTTITSINYIPCHNQQKSILFLSKQVIIENDNDDFANNENTIKSNSQVKEIISTKPRKTREIPRFSTSEPSTMTNIQSENHKIELKESQISFIELNTKNESELENKKSKSTTIEIEEEEEESISNEISINESELTTITSINYIPYQNQQQKNILFLSKQVIIENTDTETEKKIDSNNNKHPILKITKNQKSKEIPQFSTSEPLTMSNYQLENQKPELKESQISFIESNNENNNENEYIQSTQLKSTTIEIEEEEEQEGSISNEINICESELTTITSINYIPYQDQQQMNILFLSKQVTIENADPETNSNNNKLLKSNHKITRNLKPRSKEIPKFSTSEPLTMTNYQLENQKPELKESQISFIESNNENNNENEYIQSTQLKSTTIEIEEEEEQEESISNENDINESELTTITSINYIPYQDQQQKNILFLSKQVTIENADPETNSNNNKLLKTSPKKSQILKSKTKPKQKSKEIPQFSTSEPLTMNYQSEDQKINLKESQISFIESNNNNTNENEHIQSTQLKSTTIEYEEEEEDEEEEEQEGSISNEINIGESELTTITSINYIPYQNQQQKNILFLSKQVTIENADPETNSNNNKLLKSNSRKSQILKSKTKPKQKSKEIPKFSTSESSTLIFCQSEDQKTNLKESQISFIESNNEYESIQDVKPKSTTIEIEEEEEEQDDTISNVIDINESESTTITSINSIPYQDQQQDNPLVISDKVIFDNSNENTIEENKDPKLKRKTKTQLKQTKPNDIPIFSTSEPSTLTNIQSNDEKIDKISSPLNKNVKSNILFNSKPQSIDRFNDDFEIESDSTLQKEKDDLHNIDKSDLTTIISIKYDPEISKDNDQQNLDNINNDFKSTNDSEDQENNKETPKSSTNSHFTTSESQVNSLSKSKNISNDKLQNKQTKAKRKRKENETESTNKNKFTFETSEIAVISDNSLIPQNKNLNRSEFFTTEIQNNLVHDQIGIQSVTNNNSKFVENEPLTIENTDLSHSYHLSNNKKQSIPQFELSEFTTSANIKVKDQEKTHLKQSESVTLNLEQNNNNNKLDEQNEINNYKVDRKELSQLVSFYNQPEQSVSIVSESSQEKNTKQNNIKEVSNTNNKLLTINKNETFFLNNSKQENDNENNKVSQKKKTSKQKEVKFSQNMQNLKEKNLINRTETSVQTLNDTSLNNNNTVLIPSGCFYISTSDKEQKVQLNTKKSKKSSLNKQSISSQTDLNSEILPSTKGEKSDINLTLSDSLTCDNNQDLPQFEQSLITTISNIKMNNTDNQKQDILHLSFQQNTPLLINEGDKKNKNPTILFNSQSETFQSIIPQETNQFTVVNNQLSIRPESKPKLTKSIKKLSDDQTQTESNNEVFDLDINNRNEVDKSIKIPEFENSNPTTILSINEIEKHSDNQSLPKIDYHKASAQISNDNKENLETSPSIAQDITNDSIKTELVLQQQFEISKIDNENPIFETNEPLTIVSIPFENQNTDLQFDLPANNEETKTSKLSLSKNYDIFENTTKTKAVKINQIHHFELSELSNVTSVSEFNSNDQIKSQNNTVSLNFDQDLNKFTILNKNQSKEFHESLPVSIFSSNKEDDPNLIALDYENHILFEQNPERKKNLNSIDFEQSDLVNILSINKESNDNLENDNKITTNNESQESKQINKNIEITDFYQKVDQNSSTGSIVCKESDPVTIVSIQNTKTSPKYKINSNETIFTNEESQFHPSSEIINKNIKSFANNEYKQTSSISINPIQKDRNGFEVSNFICFEKNIQTSMTKVYGSLYLKPEAESPQKTKTKLSLNGDSQFYFEENYNEMKTSRSLENLDSFTIKKERNPLTMIFGSFSVSNEEHENNKEEITKQSIKTQTDNQRKDNSSMTQKNTNLNTVFGCFEIQSPSTEKVENLTTKSIEKKSYEITKGTNYTLDLSHQTENVSTSTENNDTISDIHSKSENIDKKDSFANTEKNSLSITNIFGRFDISPGTYDKEEDPIQQTTTINNEETIKQKRFSFECSNSIFIENNKIKNQSFAKTNDYFYINNQRKEENKNDFKPILLLENEPISVQVENNFIQPSYNFYSSEVIDINKDNISNLERLSLNAINIDPTNNFANNNDNTTNLEKLSLNTINIEPTQFFTNNNDNKANLEKLSLNTINIEPTKTQQRHPHLFIGKNSPSINLPEESNSISSEIQIKDIKTDQEIELQECQNLLFEVPSDKQEDKHLKLLLNQSEIQIQPVPEQKTISSNPNPIQREIVENKTFEIPLMDDSEIIQNHHQYDDEKNIEIQTSFPQFFEYMNNSQNNLIHQFDYDYDDIEQKMQLCSITNSNTFYIEPEINTNINQVIEEEEEEEKSQNNETDFNSPIFSNIDLCKKLISRQIKEIKSLEKEVVKKDVAFESLNKKFEIFKESTKKMLAKRFGEIRSLNETNAKLVSQIDSLQTRLLSKNDAVFSRFRQQKTSTLEIVDTNEIFSIKPIQNRISEKVLVTVTVEDLEPSILEMENLLQSFNSDGFTRMKYYSSRRLFISNPYIYENIGLFENFPLLRESGKITQISLLPKSSFIPLKVNTNLSFEKKEVKPSLTFSFYHLRVTRPKFFPNLHLEDNLTVAHILPSKMCKNQESMIYTSQNEMRRNIERSQFFLPGDDEIQTKKNFMIQNEYSNKKLSYFTPKPLSIGPKKKIQVLSSYEESFDINGFSPKLVIKKTQAISFIAHKKQK